MSNPSTIPRGNVAGEWVIAVNIAPAAVTNAHADEQTFSVPGLLVGDYVSTTVPTPQAGLGIVGSRVTANNVLGITFANVTAATITPTTTLTYSIRVSRVDNLNGKVPLLTRPS